MGWELNKLEKITEVEYLPGSPAIPGTEGTAGTPSYTYWETTTVGGGTWTSGQAPSGWDNETVIPLPGGGYQVLRSGGYRYFDGQKAYLQGQIGSEAPLVYIYTAPPQTIQTLVTVPAVPPVPPTPGVPATPAEILQDYNLGWNAGALGPATLAVNKALTWRFSSGSVGTVVGVSLATSPQDYSYTGMALAVMANSGQYTIYRNGLSITAPEQFPNNATFALLRTNEGTVEVYVNGALVHTEALSADIVGDASLYSGGDVIWDAQEVDAELAFISPNISATTQSGAQAVASAIAVTRTFGPNTALGVAGATTRSAAVNGAVAVNGSVYSSGVGSTASNAVAVDEALGVQVTVGAGTAIGVAGATTQTDAQAVGDPSTGVGVSTNTGTGSMSMLPLTGAGSATGVYVGWTGNYVGDSLSMLPMTGGGSADLAAPVIGIGDCVMPPMSAAVTGLTGSISVSSDNSMLPMGGFGSSELEYAQAYVALHPLTAFGTDDPYEDALPNSANITDVIIASTMTLQANYSNQIKESMNIATAIQTFYNPQAEIADSLTAGDRMQVAYLLQLAEQMGLTDTVPAAQLVRIMEQLVAADVPQTFYLATQELTDSFAVDDHEITGGGATAGIAVLDFGPPSVTARFSGYWQQGTVLGLQYYTDAGDGVVSYTFQTSMDALAASQAFAAAVDAEPLVAASVVSGNLVITAQAPATEVSI